MSACQPLTGHAVCAVPGESKIDLTKKKMYMVEREKPPQPFLGQEDIL